MSVRTRVPAAFAVVALVATTLAACGSSADDERDPATLGSSPPVAGHDVGPQPGPDRPLARLENPFSGQTTAAVEGRRLFRWFNCEGCHGGHAGGGMGPSLRDVHWIYGPTEQDIYNSIAEGRAHGMPAWGTKLSSEQIWKLTTYITSLGSSQEPSPPPQNRVYPDPPPRTEIPGWKAGD